MGIFPICQCHSDRNYILIIAPKVNLTDSVNKKQHSIFAQALADLVYRAKALLRFARTGSNHREMSADVINIHSQLTNQIN